MTLHYVASMDEFGPGSRRIIDVDGKRVVVVNYEGTVYAIADTCPHQGASVGLGDVRKSLTAEWGGPGERVEESLDGSPTISCPAHGWEYSLESGVHLGDNRYCLTTYETLIEDDELYVRSDDDTENE